MHQRAGVKLHHGWMPNAPTGGLLLRDKQDEKRIASALRRRHSCARRRCRHGEGAVDLVEGAALGLITEHPEADQAEDIPGGEIRAAARQGLRARRAEVRCDAGTRLRPSPGLQQRFAGGDRRD
jgi:hypothetical protein